MRPVPTDEAMPGLAAPPAGSGHFVRLDPADLEEGYSGWTTRNGRLAKRRPHAYTRRPLGMESVMKVTP